MKAKLGLLSKEQIIFLAHVLGPHEFSYDYLLGDNIGIEEYKIIGSNKIDFLLILGIR
jgi:hypothetical protein